jgi:hypothetical protein
VYLIPKEWLDKFYQEPDTLDDTIDLHMSKIICLKEKFYGAATKQISREAIGKSVKLNQQVAEKLDKYGALKFSVKRKSNPDGTVHERIDSVSFFAYPTNNRKGKGFKCDYGTMMAYQT